jgi:hypothetical protein
MVLLALPTGARYLTGGGDDVVVVGVGGLLLRRTPTRVPTAAVQAAIVFTLVILLATAGRPGYLIYPLNLLLWSGLLGMDEQHPGGAVPVASDPSGDGRLIGVGNAAAVPQCAESEHEPSRGGPRRRALLGVRPDRILSSIGEVILKTTVTRHTR